MKNREIIVRLIEVFKNVEATVNSNKYTEEDKLNAIKLLFKENDFTLLCRNNQSYESSIDYSRGGASSITTSNTGSVTIGCTKLTWPNKSFQELWDEQNPK